MTLQEFQNTREYVGKEETFYYEGGLVIELLCDGGETGKHVYCLTIANELYFSFDLSELELKLYNWAKDEEYFE